MMTAIGIDLGGTRIKGVAIDSEGKILHQLYRPTNDSLGEIWKSVIAETVNELKEKSPTDKVAVGISAPGLPNHNNSAIAFMPGRLQGLENFVWKDYWQQSTW